MKKMLVLSILLVLGMAPSAWAWVCNPVSSSTTVAQCLQTVFNNTGASVTSGSVMAWDDDTTNFSTSLAPFVISAVTVDDPYTAGVMLTGTCADQTLCDIVVWGPAVTRIADSSDNATVDTLVGASTTSGQAGDFAAGANTCALGMLIVFNAEATQGNDNIRGNVFVNVNCQ